MIFSTKVLFMVKMITMEINTKQQKKNREVIKINEAQIVAAIATAVKKVLASEKFRKHNLGEEKK